MSQRVRPEEYDAVLMPAGFGAAKNLCSWTFDGADWRTRTHALMRQLTEA
jgi:enhancing lycopene biosynthesis protein 2